MSLAQTNIFTYGSLMFESIWLEVVKGRYESKEGFISGYERKTVKGEIYPCLIKGHNENKVEGVVYFGVSHNDLQRLDRFEGKEYQRIKEICYLQDGTQTEVETYTWNVGLEWVSSSTWDAKLFGDEGIQLFLDRYKGFSS